MAISLRRIWLGVWTATLMGAIGIGWWWGGSSLLERWVGHPVDSSHHGLSSGVARLRDEASLSEEILDQLGREHGVNRNTLDHLLAIQVERKIGGDEVTRRLIGQADRYRQLLVALEGMATVVGSGWRNPVRQALVAGEFSLAGQILDQAKNGISRDAPSGDRARGLAELAAASGAIHELLLDYPAAIHSYREALASAPEEAREVRLEYLWRLQGVMSEAGISPTGQRLGIGTKEGMASGESDLLTTYVSLGRYYDRSGQVEEALHLWEEVVAMRMVDTLLDPADLTRILSRVAEARRVGGDPVGAEGLYRRALVLGETIWGDRDGELAHLLNNLAVALDDQRRHGEAETYYKRAIAIKERVFGLDHPALVVSLANLAMTQHALGHPAEAEAQYRRAILILLRAMEGDDAELAGVLGHLADLYLEQRRYHDAEPLYREALTMQEESLGWEHPNLARILTGLAMLARGLGRPKEAEPLLQRVLAIQERALGREHPEVGETLASLAVLYDGMNRLEEAERLQQRVLAIREQHLGPNNPKLAITLGQMSRSHQVRGQWVEAESLARRAMGILGAHLPEDHLEMAGVYVNYAQILRQLRREEEAARWEAKAAAIRSKGR